MWSFAMPSRITMTEEKLYCILVTERETIEGYYSRLLFARLIRMSGRIYHTIVQDLKNSPGELSTIGSFVLKSA